MTVDLLLSPFCFCILCRDWKVMERFRQRHTGILFAWDLVDRAHTMDVGASLFGIFSDAVNNVVLPDAQKRCGCRVGISC